MRMIPLHRFENLADRVFYIAAEQVVAVTTLPFGGTSDRWIVQVMYRPLTTPHGGVVPQQAFGINADSRAAAAAIAADIAALVNASATLVDVTDAGGQS